MCKGVQDVQKCAKVRKLCKMCKVVQNVQNCAKYAKLCKMCRDDMADRANRAKQDTKVENGITHLLTHWANL